MRLEFDYSKADRNISHSERNRSNKVDISN